MNKTALVLFAVAAFLGTAGCKSSTSPEEAAGLVGTWRATKAEFVSSANSSKKVDIIAQGSTLTLALNASTFVMTITDPGESPQVRSGTWSSSTDVLTLVTSSGGSGESQFDFSLNGNQLTLTGGHTLFDFTVGNFEEAIMNLSLVRQ
jgi:hypothetical protein